MRVKVRRNALWYWDWHCPRCRNSGGGRRWDLVLDSADRHARNSCPGTLR